MSVAQNKSREYLIDSLVNFIHHNKVDSLSLKPMLQIAEHYIRKPGELSTDIDSATVWIDRADKLSHKFHKKHELVDGEFLRGRILLETKKFEQAKQKIYQAASQYERLGDLDQKAFVIKICARYWPDKTSDEQSEKLQMFKDVAKLYNENGDTTQGNLVSVDVADVYMRSGNYKRAIEMLDSLEPKCLNINAQNSRRVNYLLSIMHRSNGNLNTALLQNLKLVKKAKAAADDQYSYFAMTQMGEIYYTLENYEKASEWFMKMLDLVDKELPGDAYQDIEIVTKSLLHLGQPQNAINYLDRLTREFPVYSEIDSISLADSRANCYAALHDNILAEKYYLDVLKHEPFSENGGLYYNDIGEFYYNVNDFQKARKFLIQSIKQKSSSVPLAELRRSYFLISKVDSALGDFRSAYLYSGKFQTVNDSIFSLRKNQQFQELQINYDTEKKDQSIELLTHQGELQQVRLEQADVMRNITFAGVVLLVIILALLYNQYSIKQKSNTQLQAQRDEISTQNKTLQHLLNEKEWLLKEVHHRVKNNLHTIVSLLESQSAYLENDALTAIRESQHRVYAMSLIHQKLYLTDNVTTIDISVYMRELVVYLRDSFDVRQRIRFDLDVEPLDLDITQAIPIGLILNEAIANAIKYAFPNEGTGVIQISVKQKAELLIFSVSDNGIGLPIDFDSTKTNSLGMRLMKGLSKEIAATFSIESSNGTNISITFGLDRSLQSMQISSPIKQTEVQEA